MTKAQLTTALRRAFGDSVIKSDGAIGKLFDSFDFKRTDEMDWRAFLYMLSMLMQPYLFCFELLRWVCFWYFDMIHVEVYNLYFV